jgi:hypothetical protein
MKSLMLGACFAAILGAPSFAQPDGQGGYQDQPDPYYDQSQPPQAPQPPSSQGGYQGRGDDQPDRGYGQYQPPPPPPAGQPGFQVYRDNQGGQTYEGSQGYEGYQPYQGYQPDGGYSANGGAYAPNRAYGYGRAGAHYTGRTGASWRNDQGQYCFWRELTWLDRNGQPAYKYVPTCRD